MWRSCMAQQCSRRWTTWSASCLVSLALVSLHHTPESVLGGMVDGSRFEERQVESLLLKGGKWCSSRILRSSIQLQWTS